MQKAGLFSIIFMMLLLVVVSSAVDVPSVAMPSVNQGGVVSTDSPTIDLYRPPTPCYSCMPEPTPAPVYETIGLSISPTSIKTKENRDVTLQATQTSGTPVLSNAAWDWVIQNPRGYGTQARGTVATFKVAPGTFGNWKINLNVRDSVQMLNGHLSTSVNIVKK